MATIGRPTVNVNSNAGTVTYSAPGGFTRTLPISVWEQAVAGVNKNAQSFRDSYERTAALRGNPEEMRRQGFTPQTLRNTLESLSRKISSNPLVDPYNLSGLSEGQRSMLAGTLASPYYGNFEQQASQAMDQEKMRRRAAEKSSGIGAVMKTIVPLAISTIGGALGGQALGLGAGSLFGLSGQGSGTLLASAARGAIGGGLSSIATDESPLSAALKGAGYSAASNVAGRALQGGMVDAPSSEQLLSAPASNVTESQLLQAPSGAGFSASQIMSAPSAEAILSSPTSSGAGFSIGRAAGSSFLGNTLETLGLKEMSPFTLLAGAGLLGGTIYSANKQADAARDAARLQQEATQAGIASQERMLERQIRAAQEAQQQARQDLQPFAQAGAQGIDQLNQLVTNPQAQAEYITNNPFYQSLAQDAQQRLFANQAARGKLGSGGTAEALQNSLVLLGQDLLNQSIGQRQNLATLGANAAAGQATGTQNTASNIIASQGGAGLTIADLLTQGGNAAASGIIGSANAGTQGLNNLINTALTAYGINKMGVA